MSGACAAFQLRPKPGWTWREAGVGGGEVVRWVMGDHRLDRKSLEFVPESVGFFGRDFGIAPLIGSLGKTCMTRAPIMAAGRGGRKPRPRWKHARRGARGPAASALVFAQESAECAHVGGFGAMLEFLSRRGGAAFNIQLHRRRRSTSSRSRWSSSRRRVTQLVGRACLLVRPGRGRGVWRRCRGPAVLVTARVGAFGGRDAG